MYLCIQNSYIRNFLILPFDSCLPWFVVVDSVVDRTVVVAVVVEIVQAVVRCSVEVEEAREGEAYDRG